MTKTDNGINDSNSRLKWWREIIMLMMTSFERWQRDNDGDDDDDDDEWNRQNKQTI